MRLSAKVAEKNSRLNPQFTLGLSIIVGVNPVDLTVNSPTRPTGLLSTKLYDHMVVRFFG